MNRTQKTAERLNKLKGASRITLFVEDDYELPKQQKAEIQRVRDAIDAWLARHRGEYKYVDGLHDRAHRPIARRRAPFAADGGAD